MTSFSWFLVIEICEKEDKKEMINLYCKKHLYVKKDFQKRQRVHRGADPEQYIGQKIAFGKANYLRVHLLVQCTFIHMKETLANLSWKY